MPTADFTQLLRKDIQEYIFEHETADEKSLVLQSKEILDVPTFLIAQQIAGRRKAKYKLPTWYATKGIIYPPSINLEQSSSEATAKYKSSIISKGKIAADLTGGFGVDSFFISKQFDRFYYVEPDEQLLSVVKHNHTLLGADNIQYVNSSAEEFIRHTVEQFDLLFIDPSRRNKQQKVFKLADCIPNVVELLPALIGKSKRILIKNSPLLDIHEGIRELEGADDVMVIAVNNECKELLFSLSRQITSSASIRAIDIDTKANRSSSFAFKQEDEKRTIVQFSSPQEWIYEPSAALLKAGAFKTIVVRYEISKLHPNTHLYTSENQIKFLSGRTFRIRQHLKMDKNIKELFPNGHANILTRNYPLSVEEIKKKTGLKEGGDLYLICTQSENEKHVLLAERIILS